MKAIGIKMVDLQPMTANEAIEKGYKTNNYTGEEKGYEVTYTDGYKSWSPKAVANIGKKFARPHAVDQIWAGLGFVLQWAKYGLTFNK